MNSSCIFQQIQQKINTALLVKQLVYTVKITILRHAVFQWSVSSPIQTNGMAPYLLGHLHQNSEESHKPDDVLDATYDPGLTEIQ